MARRPGLFRAVRNRVARAIAGREWDGVGAFDPGRLAGGLLEAAGKRGGPLSWGAYNTNLSLVAGMDHVRRRAIHASLNNGWLANGIANTVAALIGKGIKTASAHPDVSTRKELHEAYAEWGNDADSEGRMSWPAMQAAAVREMVVSGEAFIQTIYTDDGPKLKLLPSTQCDWMLSRQLPDGGYVFAGIEFDKSGKRVAYWMFPQTLDNKYTAWGFDILSQPVRVDAADCIHLMHALQPGQVRGISWAAPALIPLNELDGLVDALCVTARVAALHTAFLENANDIGGASPYGGPTENNLTNTGMEPGTIKVLPGGYKVTFNSPQQAAQGVETAKLTIQQVAAALGMPTHLVSGDLSQANFSSLREGKNAWRARCEQIQEHTIVPLLIRPVWRKWLAYSALTGQFPGLTSDPREMAAKFYPPTFPYVDPLKDIESVTVAISAGLMSRSQAVSATGDDVERLDQEIADDHAREKALGLDFTSLATKPTGFNPEPDDPNQPPGQPATEPGSPKPSPESTDDE